VGTVFIFWRIKDMNAGVGVGALMVLLAAAPGRAQEPVPGPTAAELAGAWAGIASHEGETTPIALELEPGDDGKVLIKATVPVTHLAHTPFGRAPLQVQGSEVKLGPFVFTYDAKEKTLSGALPEALVPVYRVPVSLRRVESVVAPSRPEPSAPVARPAWTFEAGAPLWPGAAFADGVVYAGGEDGRLHALEAKTGRERWAFRAGGAIRSRAAVAGEDVFLQADDGFLYKLAAASGEERWRVRVTEKPIERLPFDDPKSRFDRFGSDVTVAGGRLHLGTHDGRVLAIDPAKGTKLWEFAAGDSVLAAPAVAGERVYFGSYDRHVYALVAATGQLVWKRDTKGAVVSTPAVDGDRVVVGNRCYDLLGLDLSTGETVWKRYLWFSWVESSPAIRDGVAYVGSSDAAGAYAFDVRTGERRWATDVYGWAWGQPAVTDERVYVGTASQVGYLAQHQGGAMALDRASGRPVWRFPAERPAAGAYGFPGSPAVGSGLVFLTGLDGRVYAFAP
jgi:outer membrane protein assembly factor BamB